MKILHIISGLGVGGAETLLYRLINESHGGDTQHVVVSLSALDLMGDRMRALGVEVRILGMSRGAPQPHLIGRMIRWILEIQPDVVQTWMYHADLLGGVAARVAQAIMKLRDTNAPRLRLVWAIHQTSFPTFRNELRQRLVATCCAWMSAKIPDVIVCCAETARSSHADGGYCVSRMQVVRNGFDIDLFRPRDSARSDLRALLGIEQEALIVGIVGRYHPAKDYANFVAAIGSVSRRLPDCHYIMVGKGLDAENPDLRRLLADVGITEKCHLLGPRDNLHLLLPGFDVFCLSSRSEGFPTVVGEAMACAVPCVVTDVGDTALLVGKSGLIVPAEDASALAAALLSLLVEPEQDRRRRGQTARERIRTHFSIQSTWQNYQRLYAAVQQGDCRCADSPVS
ncbi:glycosyltransferase [Paraburkholderia sp. CNPSo 3157]|uniref:Glycosyltransferase n=1 Tax=Paraburkholderia franconis TaxID=2654983 RepID=A0A7X1TFI6_9BURK|nr:glycosyltransferase [Paraburkholderia franconis]MPW17412.1 glycosyltransferase [Paraburkholderia franconis]